MKKGRMSLQIRSDLNLIYIQLSYIFGSSIFPHGISSAATAMPFSCIIILKPTVYTKLMYIIPLALNKKEWVSKAIWGKNHFVNLQVFQGRFKLQVCGGEWKAKIVARFGQIWRLCLSQNLFLCMPFLEKLLFQSLCVSEQYAHWAKHS